MKTRLLCLVALLCFAPLASAEPPAKTRVLLTYGGHGFEEKPFFATFDALPNVTYTKAELPKQADLLDPGAADRFDVIVMYDMVAAITPAQQAAFKALLNRGIGVVSLHHNMGAHREWNEWRQIIGGKFIFGDTEIDGKKYSQSGWAHDQDLNVTIVDKEHPITRGLKDFQIHDETYSGYYVSPKANVLLKTDHPKNEPRIAWTTEYGKSRVFYLMLGHDAKAWQNPAFAKLLEQGIQWAAGK
jgi:hypothetical protein